MNNHAYQYNCPSDEPNTETHQAIEDLSTRTTEKLDHQKEQMQARQGQPQYKYDFEEFEGPAGLDLLRKTINAILPGGLARTWEIVRRWEKPDQDPYVGTERISEKAQRGLRVIQLDLQRLEEMGLMRVYKDLVTTDSGHTYNAHFKDFSNLYRLAHEYHLFTQTIEYQRYQPTWENADEIKAMCEVDPTFKKFLLRFENYRKVILHQKPGRKKIHKEDIRYTNDGDGLGEHQENNRHFLPKTKRYFNGSSPYESNLNKDIDSLDSNLTQDLNLIQEVSPLTRSSGGEYLHDEQGTHEDFTGECGKGSEEYSFSIPISPKGNISQREAEPSSQRKVPQVAKSVTAQQKGKTYIEAVLTEEDRKHSTPKQERRNKWLESEGLRKRCQTIINIMQDIAHELNDQTGKSTLTTVAKIYERSQMTPEAFAELIYYARGKVRSIPEAQIKVKDLRGKANRVPLFIRILEDTIEKGLAAMQAADAEYEAKREERQTEQAEEPVIDQEAFDEVVDTFLRPALEASHQTRQEIMREVEASDQEPEQVQKPVDKWAEARDQIREEMPGIGTVTISKLHQCSCGCKLVIRQGATVGCVVCKPPANWSRDFRRRVAEIVAQARLEEAV